MKRPLLDNIGRHMDEQYKDAFTSRIEDVVHGDLSVENLVDEIMATLISEVWKAAEEESSIVAAAKIGIDESQK